MTLTGSGGSGWRIVSQPTNGTVAISNNNLAVYFPGQGFAGTDTFTFAASNGYNDSATLGDRHRHRHQHNTRSATVFRTGGGCCTSAASTAPRRPRRPTRMATG